MTDSEHLSAEGEALQQQTSVGNTPGAATWPEGLPATVPPPVGLNWGTVAGSLGADLRVLLHEGLIVLAGQYFPEEGFFLDPQTLEAEHVDVGDIALRHGYFIGNLTVREFKDRLRVVSATPASGLPVIHREAGPIIGLFAEERAMQRARTAILQGAVGSGIRAENGPLGMELRIDRPSQPGAVASVIASHGGAVISIDGTPVSSAATAGSLSTARGGTSAEADVARRGTGSTSDSQAPAERPGSSEEFRSR